MGPADKSPKTRQWLNQVHGEIKRGGFDLDRVLSDNGGVAPFPNHWASVIGYVCAHSKKAERETMMRILLAHPDFPKETGSQDCMLDAVRRRAFECIPLLHAAGFTLQADILSQSDREHLIVDKISSEISNGRWPHVELIYPQLLDDPSSHRNIAEGIFNETTRQRYNVCKNLVKLSPSEALNRMISKRLGRMGNQLSVRGEDGIEKALIPMCILMGAGWLDLDLARKEADEDGQGNVVQPLLASLEREVLSLQTPNALRKNNRIRI